VSQGLFERLYSTEKPFALIDTRERRDYVNGHWFGSTNIALSTLTPQIKKLIPDKALPIHLLDWQDAPSDAAANQLSKLGYSNIVRHKSELAKEFGQGFVKGEFVWSKAFGEVLAHVCGLQEVTPAEYLTHYKHAQFFDVRPTAEYAQFTIPESQSLPNSLLLANMEALKSSSKFALLHCAGRTRSIIGACTLKAAGYSGPYAIFKGGTQAWQLDGLEREFDANRVFAIESDNATPVKAFLQQWNINFSHVDNDNLDSFISANGQQYLIDVSDDAATGQLAEHNIIKISGTNLIQQTDRSIACYHIPVTLFDHGSGSRAAFAAFWLQNMGFRVSVVYVDKAISLSSQSQHHETPTTPYPVLSIEQLLSHREATGTIFDFRTSQSYAQGHLSGSQWRNISEVIADGIQFTDAIIVIGSDLSHSTECATLLDEYGATVSGVYSWNHNEIDSTDLQQSDIKSAIDRSALFAGRHHGNQQDSRDYLAWEEDLPEQIDPLLHQTWLRLLGATIG
jgi:rhodanese-related sulfurtransferase